MRNAHEAHVKALPNRSPLRRVVVATDFSVGGARAIERAARLLGPGSAVTLVHVLPAAMRDRREVAATAHASLDGAASRISQVTPGATVDSLVAYGDGYEKILRPRTGSGSLAAAKELKVTAKSVKPKAAAATKKAA